jgi:hypothetical protein
MHLASTTLEQTIKEALDRAIVAAAVVEARCYDGPVMIRNQEIRTLRQQLEIAANRYMSAIDNCRALVSHVSLPITSQHLDEWKDVCQREEEAETLYKMARDKVQLALESSQQ